MRTAQTGNENENEMWLKISSTINENWKTFLSIPSMIILFFFNNERNKQTVDFYLTEMKVQVFDQY